ncbi:serine hydrolase FSH [Aspergillus alliaceus]|uniref:Serine hydrolase FSH n=1 Tax=Petromyces alliaceus TaxID=209559 RepID=A0A5N7C291_PETAA|nr:serine hydrolase FSH [Aspergillus alliaceus]KAB8227684.1 serine hydrolase FSH [Aspergillus alliaceus]KAE8388149.1 serine hydrolase FSH [Aspergillus alliaceus]
MNPETKPAIICLHGHGSSGEIFQAQSQNLTRVLSPHFRFLFLNSPITTAQAGVGVPLYYAHIKPYRRWHQDRNTIGLFDVTVEDVERERRVVRDSLKDVIERERRNGPGAGVVGVMGFSQGTRVATAVCLDPELGRDIKFAIMICGICPSLPLSAAETQVSRPLDIVSVHVQGSGDPWLAKGTRLSKQYFNQRLATVVRFKGGHEIPVKTGDVQNIAEVMAEYRDRDRGEYDSVPAVEVASEVAARMVSA